MPCLKDLARLLTVLRPENSWWFRCFASPCCHYLWRALFVPLMWSFTLIKGVHRTRLLPILLEEIFKKDVLCTINTRCIQSWCVSKRFHKSELLITIILSFCVVVYRQRNQEPRCAKREMGNICVCLLRQFFLPFLMKSVWKFCPKPLAQKLGRYLQSHTQGSDVLVIITIQVYCTFKYDLMTCISFLPPVFLYPAPVWLYCSERWCSPPAPLQEAAGSGGSMAAGLCAAHWIPRLLL